MKRIHVDYLIAGAGLAGSVMGFLLKKAGADVLALELLDAKTKEKLCGGIMNKGALMHFAQVFGESCEDTLRPMHITKHRDRYAGCEILIDIDKEVYHALPRKRLDDYCLERYLQAGGNLQDRTTVCEIDDSTGVAVCADLRTGETFEVEFDRIIGADGAMSAQLLVKSLLNGISYKEAMEPQTDYVAKLAQESKKKQFVYRFFILRKGKPAKPFASEKYPDTTLAE